MKFKQLRHHEIWNKNGLNFELGPVPSFLTIRWKHFFGPIKFSELSTNEPQAVAVYTHFSIRWTWSLSGKINCHSSAEVANWCTKDSTQIFPNVIIYLTYAPLVISRSTFHLRPPCSISIPVLCVGKKKKKKKKRGTLKEQDIFTRTVQVLQLFLR